MFFLAYNSIFSAASNLILPFKDLITTSPFSASRYNVVPALLSNPAFTWKFPGDIDVVQFFLLPLRSNLKMCRPSLALTSKLDMTALSFDIPPKVRDAS